jgi:arginase family enzyme
MVEEFIVPLSEEEVAVYSAGKPTTWGRHVTFYNKNIDYEEGYDIAILGVKETRNSHDNIGCEEAPDVVRQELYKLTKNAGEFKIIDLGNIEKGATVQDTYIALKYVLNDLIKSKILPVVIGGSHDLTYAQYLAYEDLRKPIHFVVADEKIDLFNVEDTIYDENFLMKIFTHAPNYLFNFSIIGHQAYYVHDDAVATLERLNFDSYRLGALRKKMEEMEPVLRDADFLSFDMQAIRSGDSQGVLNATPNGLYAEEACQIMRYAGLSNRLTSLGIYQYNPAYDYRYQSAQLMAQMIWYFTDGFYARKNDNPAENEEGFLKFIVDISDTEHELVFYKSKLSDRWWMEINDAKEKKTHFISCSYNDYKQATSDEIPDKWLKSLARFS